MLLSNPWRHKCDPLEDEIRWAPQLSQVLATLALLDALPRRRQHLGAGAATVDQLNAMVGTGNRIRMFPVRAKMGGLFDALWADRVMC